MVIAALGPGTRSARAQYGTGMGMGMGGFHYASSPTDYLNQRARLNAARPGAPVTQGSIAGNPNAYDNKVRDDGLVPHYDRRFGQPPAERSHHPGSLGDQVNRQPAVDSTAASSRPKQMIPLSNFFDASQKLVWPGEATAEVGLKEKREIFERASLAVLKESRQNGVASTATVTAARQKLLDYGRPALQQVRASSTPQVVDTFHHFLLSLYDSLARSAARPEITPGSAPKP
ncbi:MAG: hypothetical protein ACXVBO_07870 [Isosphaeraceae bacterium]